MLEKQLQLEHLLPDLGCHALEEQSDLPGSLAVQRQTPPTLAPAGPADSPGGGGRAVAAEAEAAVGEVESRGDLAGRPPADVAVKPHWGHGDRTGLI